MSLRHGYSPIVGMLKFLRDTGVCTCVYVAFALKHSSLSCLDLACHRHSGCGIASSRTAQLVHHAQAFLAGQEENALPRVLLVGTLIVVTFPYLPSIKDRNQPSVANRVLPAYVYYSGNLRLWLVTHPFLCNSPPSPVCHELLHSICL